MRENLEIKKIPISKITWGKKRFRDDYTEIEGLRESIEEKGLLQTLLVFPIQDGQYLLAAGGRRLIALTELMKKGKIPDEVNVTLCPSGMSMLDLRLVELEENIQRVDLSPIERANLTDEIHTLMVQKHGVKKSTAKDAKGWSQEDTAKMMGQSAMNVTRDIRIAKAARLIPGVGDAKSKKDAWKIVEKAVKLLEIKEKVAEIEARDADEPDANLKQRIVDAYIVGDFFDEIKKVDDGIADLIELDPPYGIDLQHVKKVAKPHDTTGIDAYNEVDPKDYASFMQRTLKECYRVGKKDSWLLCWCGPEPWFESMYQWITKAGYKTHRMVAIWYKKTGQTLDAPRRLGNGYEIFFYARKGDVMLNRPGRLNVYEYTPIHVDKKYHPTQKPMPLMIDIYTTFVSEGSRVIIPFLGSGVGLLAASNLKMTAFGYELSKEYKEHFIVRAHGGVYGRYI